MIYFNVKTLKSSTSQFYCAGGGGAKCEHPKCVYLHVSNVCTAPLYPRILGMLCVIDTLPVGVYRTPITEYHHKKRTDT